MGELTKKMHGDIGYVFRMRCVCKICRKAEQTFAAEAALPSPAARALVKENNGNG